MKFLSIIFLFWITPLLANERPPELPTEQRPEPITELPLDIAAPQRTFKANELMKTFNGVRYPLLAVKTEETVATLNDTFGPRKMDDSEKERAEKLCHRFKYAHAVKDKIPRANVANVPLFDVNYLEDPDNVPALYTPLECFEPSEEVSHALNEMHFWGPDRPIDSLRDFIKKLNLSPCSPEYIKIVLDLGFAVDTDSMTSDQANEARQRAKQKTGYASGKILRSTYFVSLTCQI